MTQMTQMAQMTQMRVHRSRPRNGRRGLWERPAGTASPSAAGRASSPLACGGCLRLWICVICVICVICGSGVIWGQGRLFPPQDLGLLEAPDREEWQRPDQIMDALAVAEASVVADVGAGSGWFTIQLARRVGPNGTVYAQDVQQPMLAAISRRVQREGLTNVRTVLGRGTDPRLPHNALDAVLIVGVYHEIDDPVTLLANLARALKPHGRIGVVDFKLEGGGPGPSAEERVSPEVVVQDAQRAGLQLLKREMFLPYQYFLIFSRGPTTAAR